jgi:flagellum-specific ATP synthase
LTRNSRPLAALADFANVIQQATLAKTFGRVKRVSGQGIEIEGLSNYAKAGEFVEILAQQGPAILTQVIAVNESSIFVKSSGSQSAIAIGDKATPIGPLAVFPDSSWKGRMLNAVGQPIDGGPALKLGSQKFTLDGFPPPVMERQNIGPRIATGVVAIDVFTPLCLGQRMGIFAGSGVGKSTLLGMLSRSPDFDCIVVALVGERSREVREFVHDVLGNDQKKSVVIVATSDEPAVIRKSCALLSTRLAEYFRDRGDKVLLIMDSITRYAQACREIALSAGEPPVARGFPPSVFNELPMLLERAGPGPTGLGSISGLYTVLVDGDDHNDPVADSIRGTLDGHIVLDRDIAAMGRYPAIDILQSISRLANKAWSPLEATTIVNWKRLLVRYEESRDLRAMGGYTRNTDLELDAAVVLAPRLYGAITQRPDDVPCTNGFAKISQAVSDT